MTEQVELARASGPRGDVSLRRRGSGADAVEELIVNGVFAMDSVDPTSERALGELALPTAGARVLLGGLGLGYTAGALLERELERLDVVELEPALIDWARSGITAPLARVAGDPRVRLIAADVADVLARPDSGPWDAILLDVDNGPDFLIQEANAGLYEAPGLRQAYDRLRPGGILGIWCQGPSAELRAALTDIAPQVQEHRYRHQRGRRDWSYVIYVLRREQVPPS